MSSSTTAILGKRALHSIFAEDYIDWATEMLMQDYDSPNLRILAGLDRRSSRFQVEWYFERSLNELNIEPLEFKAAVWAYAAEIAQQIVEGQLSPQNGVRALYEIWLDTDYDSEFVIWIELDDALDNLHIGEIPYTYPSATWENFDDIVRQEAAKFITRMQIEANTTPSDEDPHEVSQFSLKSCLRWINKVLENLTRIVNQ